MKKSRSKNVALNIIFGYIAQIGILILSFIGRKIFLHFLSVDYLGINGLYSNILSVLSMAELGLGNALLFSLYKPVLDNNHKMIVSLIKYFKKIYISIALIVLIIGVSLVPFLNYIVNSNLQKNELIIYYLLFLFNTIASYLSAYKIALLSANQDNRIQNSVALFISGLQQIFHIAVLLIWKNYYIYIISTIICTLLNNIILSFICNKKYPYLKEGFQSIEFDKIIIVSNIKSTFLYKIGVVIINNTDNILISTLVSTVAVGIYSNYYMIISAIQSFISIITNSLISSIGNLCAENNRDKMRSIFNSLTLFYHTIAAFGSICFYYLFNDFITLWLGNEYLFDNTVVFSIAFNFYLTTLASPVWMFREAGGLFSNVKFLMLATAFLNIVFSIILGSFYGVFGILFASALSRIATSIWYEPQILFKKKLGRTVSKYWFNQIKFILLTITSFTICSFINNYLGNSFIYIILKSIIYTSITCSIFFTGTLNTVEQKELLNFIKNLRNN